MNPNKPIPLTDYQQQVLDGILLGDACIPHRDRKNRRLEYASKERDLVSYVINQFPEYDFREPFVRKPYTDGWQADCVMWGSYSATNESFTAARRKWYPGDVKCPPDDLKITETVALFWYLGDGSLQKRAGRSDRINLSTHGFSMYGIDVLLKELKRIGFDQVGVYKDYGKPRLYLKHDVRDWLTFVGPCPVACMQYKWDTDVDHAGHRWLTREERECVFSLRSKGFSQYKIATFLGKSQPAICRALQGATYAG
jgi:LAGLIDADG DNA endonuclease family